MSMQVNRKPLRNDKHRCSLPIVIIFLGTNFGTIISLPISGWLCSLEFDGGWPLCFYIFGGVGIIWFIFWMFLVYDTPTSHPRIDKQEQAYILASIGPQVSPVYQTLLPPQISFESFVHLNDICGIFYSNVFYRKNNKNINFTIINNL